MAASIGTGTHRLSEVRRYRRLMDGSIAVGVVGFVVGDALGHPPVGVGIYCAGVLGDLALWRGSSVTLFDERERAIERER